MATANSIRDENQGIRRFVTPTDFTPALNVRRVGGDVVGVLNAQDTVSAGNAANVMTEGLFQFTKATGIVLLPGQDAWWSVSNSNVSYTGDYRIGTVDEEAASAATTVNVRLNHRASYVGDLTGGQVTRSIAATGGTAEHGGLVRCYAAANAAIEHAWVASIQGVDVDDGFVFEGWFNVASNGDNAALDIDFGVGNAAPTTDADALTEFVLFHLDGATLDLDAHSDDGTTDTPPVDTDADVVVGTPFFAQIDGRDKSSVKLYVNGVLVTSTGITLAAATGVVKAIVGFEKTSNDTPGEIQCLGGGIRHQMPPFTS